MIDAITIVTVSTGKPKQPYYCFDAFFASCRRFGYEPLVLTGGYTGLGSKPRMLKAAIEAARITTEHMIFSDCFDVIMQRDPRAIELPVNARILWGAEKTCFPDASLAGQHPESPTSYQFLNSGVGFGETAAFLEMLIHMQAETIPGDHQVNGQWMCPNDQDFVMRELLFGPVPMSLDYECRLVQNLCSVSADELDLSGPLIRNKETNSYPAFLHLNGPAKTDGLREPILKHLGLT